MNMHKKKPHIYPILHIVTLTAGMIPDSLFEQHSLVEYLLQMPYLIFIYIS